MSKMYSSAETGESKSNLKYRAIKKSMTGLVDLIDATGTMKVALRLFQEDFLNESTYYGLEESKTGDGARKIVGELLKKMKVNPDERYEKLMEVLDEEKMLDAVRLIKKKYNELHDAEERLCHSTKGKDSRKRTHSECSPKSIKQHKMMEEDPSEIIQKEGSLSHWSKNELESINEAQIRGKYCSLTNIIICRLEAVSISKIKNNITTLFDPEDVSFIYPLSDLNEIFGQMTMHHFWNFREISKLTELASLHIKEDSEIEKAIEKYNDDLIGYKTCKMIYKNINSMQQESEEELEHEKDEIHSYNIEERKKFVVKLLKGEGKGHVKVSELCMNYLEEIFEKMKLTFNFKLDAVLEKVATGCIEITWYIPSISAWKILGKLPESLQFLKEESISAMFLEDVLIFSDARGVINSKELKKLQLLLAVQDNNSEQAISLMRDSPGILNEALQSHGRTLLMIASFRGSVDIISSMIDHEASIKIEDEHGWTALAYALVSGKQEAFNFLIRKGATLTLETKGSKYKNILDLIERHQLQLSEENLNQSMILASKSGELKFVEKFIEMGADVTALDQDKEGWKALTWASFNGHLDVVKHLVDSGAELNVECGENEWTALQLASRNGFYEIVDFLLDHGADVNQKNKMDESETLKNYLSQIPEQFHKNLDELIDEEIICMVADSLKEDWSARYDLLKLTFNELRDIQEENTLAQSQRIAALKHWKNKLGSQSTYKSLLEVCVCGNWHDSAKNIVSFISSQKMHSELLESIGSSKHPRIESKSIDKVSDTKISFPREYMERKIEFETALSVIGDVSKYVNLGLQFKVSSRKNDEIHQYSPGEQKKRIIQAWFDHDPNPTYKTLYQALLKPSVDDKRAARRLLLGLSKSIDSSISVDESSSDDTTIGGPDLPFNEASVLNAIAKISDDYTLGVYLELDDATLNELKKYPVNEQKQKLVAQWFAVEDPKHCNWTKLNAAINKMKVLEWNDSFHFTSTALQDSTASLHDNVYLCHKEELKAINEHQIQRKYSSLARKIIQKLEEVDIEKLKYDLANIFDPEDISDIISSTNDIYEIFRQLTRYHFWSFNDINKLTELASLHIEDSKIENAIKKYNEDLIGYKTCTLIGEKINFDSIQQESDEELEHKDKICSVTKENDPSCYNVATRKKLIIKLLEGEGGRHVKVTDLCLLYLEEIFEKMKQAFNLTLDAVFKKVATGCIEITWYIPSISAWKILGKLPDSLQFLKDEGLTTMFLEDVLIFSDTRGVINSKVKELQLLLAVQDNNFEQVISLLKDSSKILSDAVESHGQTLLMSASLRGSVDIISSLIDHGASINVQDAYGWTALAYALVARKQEAYNFLIRKGATLTLQSKGSKYTNILDLIKRHQLKLSEENLNQSMILASKTGEFKFVEKFIEMGADVTALDQDKYTWTALHWASDRGHLDVVDHLLNCGAELDAEDQSNWTSLVLASRNGHIEVVKRLLNGGADPNKTKKTTWTPLMWAAECNHLEITKVLLERGANPNIYDQLGLSPLYQAAQNGNKSIVEALVEDSRFKVEINYTIEMKWPALFVAVTNGHEEIVEYLVEKGADLSYQERDDTAALHLACFKENFFITELLLKNNANIDVQDKDGLTPLMFAASHGQLKLVRLLVEDGKADLNIAENINQWTAMFFAMQAKHHDVMKYLLDTKRIKLNHKDEKGNTLFDLAETLNPEAFEYFKANFKEDEELVEQERTAAGLPKLTAKILMGEIGSPYYAPMIEKIYRRSSAGASA